MSDVSSRKSRLTVPSGGNMTTSATGVSSTSANSNPTIMTGTNNSNDYSMSPNPHNKNLLLSSNNPLLASSTLPSILSPTGFNRAVFSSSSQYYGGQSSSSSQHHGHHGHGSGMSNNINPLIQYIHRFLDISQMDIQNALDQMTTLISSRPQLVYKTSYYRKQTKNHWYRDDPAFIVLQLLFLLIACLAYNIAFRTNIITSISFILYSILWNYISLGIIVSTICREIANRHLNINNNKVNNNNYNAYSSSSTSPPPSTTSLTNTAGGNTSAGTTSASIHVKQQVEWLYSFDIHCNSFFPVFVVLCK